MLRPTAGAGLRVQARPRISPTPRVRLPRSVALSFCTDAASHAANRVQVHVSRCSDPWVNLAVEHHLLQVTPPDSTVLTLYSNSPSVVIGRNQNPWIEANLALMARSATPVRLVRRRSGGGTVFHDAGNVNYSVISPAAAFDRSRHAEMVVRALAGLGATDARVNERHDIVIGGNGSHGDGDGDAGRASFKVSGSAYKLTRLRALHHGTCLLRGADLAAVSALLRSPAHGFVKALGVGSVRSPVAKLDVDNADFEAAVVRQFEGMYGDADVHEEFDETALDVEAIARGCDELRSRSWIYGQTPRFTLSTHPTEEDPRVRLDLPFDLNVVLRARHGVINDFEIGGALSAESLDVQRLKAMVLYDVKDWRELLQQVGLDDGDARLAGGWMNEILGTEYTMKGNR